MGADASPAVMKLKNDHISVAIAYPESLPERHDTADPLFRLICDVFSLPSIATPKCAQHSRGFRCKS